jgi:predicted ABC-type ATPase
MRSRVGDLARRRSSFAFETTLAGRALWLQEIINTGYLFHLLFLWLPSADFALERVANRVAMGGHDVPEATIRRRYVRGLQNFFDVYQPMTATWRMYDNSAGALPRLVAAGRGHTVDRVLNQRTWDRIQQGAHAEG